MWKDKNGSSVTLLDKVSFIKENTDLVGTVVAVMDNDHILTIKTGRGMYFEVMDSDCELKEKGKSHNNPKFQT